MGEMSRPIAGDGTVGLRLADMVDVFRVGVGV
jgi:hypothetical protein